jgi:chromosome segregation ATPase
MKDRESHVRKLENKQDTLRKTLHRLEAQRESQRLKISEKEAAIRDAELNGRSSDHSLSLPGKVKALEKQVEESMINLDAMQKDWIKKQEDLLALTDKVTRMKAEEENMRCMARVRENQKRRILSELEDSDIDAKRLAKEIAKLKFDMDKAGEMIIRFDQKIQESKGANQKDSEQLTSELSAEIERLTTANDKSEKAISNLKAELESLEAQGARVDRELVEEKELHSRLQDTGAESAELEKLLRRMKKQLSEVNKRIKRSQRAAVQSLNKRMDRDVESLIQMARGSMSCSTLASTLSQASLEIVGIRAVPNSVDFEREIFQEFQRIEEEEFRAGSDQINQESLQEVLEKLHIWKARLEKRTEQLPNRLLEWINYNLKLLKDE